MSLSGRLAAAKREAAYFDNYITYLNTLDDRQPNIGQGTDKPPQIELYMKPFGLTLTPTQFLAANGTASRWTTYKDSFTNKTAATAGETAVVLPIKSYSPARVVIKEGVGAKVVKTSRRTKKKYVSRGGVSGSIPFGKEGTKTELQCYEEILASLKAKVGENNETVKFSRVREKF